MWANPQIFKLDDNLKPLFVSGVPPDYFSSSGQRWGNPVYDWDSLQKQSFKWWIKRFKQAFEIYDAVRLDHFRGFVAYWEIPSSERTAINGKWVKVPVYEFFDEILKKIKNFNVIVEDLGVITEDVKEVIKHYNFTNMKVLQFSFYEDNPRHPYLPHNYDKNCVVYTGTHDNNTISGWFEEELDENSRLRFENYVGKKITSDNVVEELVRLAFSSVSLLSVITLQDVFKLGSFARTNTPGTSQNNWKWKMKKSFLQESYFEWVAKLNYIYNRF